jgi:hypothetical protein
LTEHPKATASNWTTNGQRQANGAEEGPIFIQKKAEDLVKKMKGERELHKV